MKSSAKFQLCVWWLLGYKVIEPQQKGDYIFIIKTDQLSFSLIFISNGIKQTLERSGLPVE